MLLLKPWRNSETDLKSPSQSWKEAYESSISAASAQGINIVEGIQFFHSCKHAADAAQESQGMEAILVAERAARMEEGMAGTCGSPK